MFQNEPNNQFYNFKNQSSFENEQKKGTLKIQVINLDFSTKSVPE